MGLHDSYPSDSTSRMHSGFGYEIDGQPFQILPDYDATDGLTVPEVAEPENPESSQVDTSLDFHSEVVAYASTVKSTDPHVLAALRAQSNCYAEILRCEVAGDIAGSAAAQRQLDIYTQNNSDLIDRANAIRREFVRELAKSGFFVR